MRWPFMLKQTCERVLKTEADTHGRLMALQLDRFQKHVKGLNGEYQAKVDAEYERARAEGIAQVHAWAVEVNYSLFCGESPFGGMSGTQDMRARAALQDAEGQFAPARTQLDSQLEPKEITDGTLRP